MLRLLRLGIQLFVFISQILNARRTAMKVIVQRR